MTLYHGSTGLIGDTFDAGTWCCRDILEAAYHAQRKGGNKIYVFIGADQMRRGRKYYRLTSPREPDLHLQIIEKE